MGRATRDAGGTRATDNWQHMIDSTMVRGHSQAAGGKRGTSKEGFGRSRGGFTARPTTVRTVRDALVAPPVANPKRTLADKGYNRDDARSSLLIKGILPVIPPRTNRKGDGAA